MNLPIRGHSLWLHYRDDCFTEAQNDVLLSKPGELVSIPNPIICVTPITQLHRIGSGFDGCAIVVTWRIGLDQEHWGCQLVITDRWLHYSEPIRQVSPCVQQLGEDLLREEQLKDTRHEDNTAYSQQTHPHAGSSALPRYNMYAAMLHMHMHPLPPLVLGATPDIREQDKTMARWSHVCMYALIYK